MVEFMFGQMSTMLQMLMATPGVREQIDEKIADTDAKRVSIEFHSGKVQEFTPGELIDLVLAMGGIESGDSEYNG